ncbi:TonB-dependent receptor [Pontibacter sp. CAU 1760]
MILLLLCAVGSSFAQRSYVLSGRVTDAVSGQGLAGAAIGLRQYNLGATTDAKGYFSFTAPAGAYTLGVSYIGYTPQQRLIELYSDSQLNIMLAPASYQVQEVEVKTTRQPPITETATLGQLELPMETIKTLPVLFGEVDILKTVQLLPGVQSGGEGNTGFYVRGGGSDQNLVLLDKATIYNPGHLFNFFSVFNSDAIENTTLTKGSMPARYGGRLSSVLDIEGKDGDTQGFRADGGIGLISSRLTVQGPLAQDKASFILSGRRTYIDALLNPFLKNTDQGGVPYRFYDLNGKLQYHLSPRDELSLSGYYGRDIGNLKLSDGRFTSKFFWGNATATALWRHQFNDNWTMDVSGVLSKYTFEFNWDYGGYETILQTGVRDYTSQVDFKHKLHPNHNLQYGVQYTYNMLRPRTGEAIGEDGENFGTTRVLPKFGHASAIYVSDDWSITPSLLLSLGFRNSFFTQVGPFNLYSYNPDETVADSVVYGNGEAVKSFSAPEPRISVRYLLSGQSSLKAGFTRSAQYLHLVSNAYTTLPLDVWVPSSAIVEPQRATQFALGYFQSFAKNQYEGSVEVYYKDLENQLEYRQGYSPGPSNRDLEYEFVSGNGTSYGAEFFLRKNYGDFQGWIGYTLSKTTRQFPDLNNGNKFPARFDRRHDLSIVGSYHQNERWTFGGSYVLGTGQATTLPVRRYYLEGTVNYQYGSRNSFRMQPTHRLDLAATLTGKKSEHISSSWTFSVYNVYGRRNPFLYYVDSEGSPDGQNFKLQAKKVSIIPFPLPSVTWNFSWK